MIKSLMIMLVALTLTDCTDTFRAHKGISSLDLRSERSVDGVYEFVSETTIFISPIQSEDQRSESDWRGIWIFKNGYFSKTMMKKERSEWIPGKFPNDARGTGFDGAAGTYEIDGETIRLKYALAFYPGAIYREDTMSFAGDFENLVLTMELLPTRESESRGRAIVQLRRIAGT